ncbi:helix-turn-helix domain-containing protein [Labilibaculum sp. K2S]|uniref:helix-turn-helix domain-containing protein n=1 Tax=Labilibaculum sp. K2S TaxID=3056386 RepID=UPI0025A451BA|nr:helix-turn-helix domain-containing protein [Labilibaculum sp. K2S]MDM8161171.1 helix-turn-helix domain-containing protein [Labilibaculum sp. K2S]
MKAKVKSPIAINELILSEMNRQGLSAADFAQKLQISMNSMYHILKRPSMQIDRLWEVCEALQLNFFKVLADEIKITNPVDPQMDQLQRENKMLREVIQLLGSSK